MIDKELEKAQENLKDMELRGAEAIGEEWDKVRQDLFTSAEIEQSDLRVGIISEFIQARLERGISRAELERLSGVKEGQIEKLERGNSSALFTLQKLLLPLGKKLAIVSI